LWGNLGDSYFYTDVLKDAARVAYGRAIEIAEQELDIKALDADTMSDLAHYYSRVGETEKSRELIQTALAAEPNNMYVHYYSALVHAHLGETSEALGALERAVELQYETNLLASDAGFRSIMSEERFQKLIARND
jgi:tetratricopeptide (TPR) repeat protein